MKNLINSYIEENKEFQKHLEGKYPQMEKALSELERKGFPTKKLENWKYTNVAPLLEDHLKLNPPNDEVSFEDFLLPGEGPLLVFVNGHLIESRDFKGLSLKVESLTNSPAKIGEVSGDDSFDLLNLSSLSNMVTVEVEKETVVERPLQILHLSTDAMQGYRIHPRVAIRVGTYSKLDVLETFAHVGSEKNHYLVNAVTDIKVGEGAKVEHVKAQMESLSSLHVSRVNAKIGKDAFFNSFTFTIGSKLGRNNLYVSLEKEGGEAHVHGVFVLRGDQHCDNFSIIDHKVAHTNSEQLFKGIVDDNAHGIFTGKIIVNPHAQLTNSQQTSKNLLLSRKAHINTRPILEIYADDVKCAHGATVGQLNENEVFYLESRGIPKEKAQRILCHGFAQEGIDTIMNPLIREKIGTYLNIQLNKFNIGHFNEL